MSKYNEDLDYLILDVDISKAELNEIIVEADKIIVDNNSERDKLIEAYLKKVQCLQRLEKYTESKEFLDKLLNLSPNMPDAITRLAFIYDINKEYDKAIDCTNKAIEINPDYAYAYFRRGYAKSNLPNPDNQSIIEDYNKAIELKSDYMMAYNNRGVAYKDKGDLDHAIENYDKAIDVNPKFDLARNNRVKAYHAKDENLAMPLVKIRKNEEYMDELKDNIAKVVPFLGAGVSKQYGYYTWKELLEQLLILCCDEYDVPIETKEKIQKDINTENYLKAANELDKIFPNISNAVGILIERKTKDNPIQDNMRSILSEYLHLFPNKKYLTTNYDTVVQDILELQEDIYVNALYPTSGLILPKKRKKRGFNQDSNPFFNDDFFPWIDSRTEKETVDVYYLHGVYDDPNTIIISEFQYDDWYGMTYSNINYKLRRYLPSQIFNIYHNSIFLYIGCGMTVKQDRILKIMGDFHGTLRNTTGYALLNVNTITKADEPYENWKTLSVDERRRLNEILDKKERELKISMNVHVIWYSAPSNSKDKRESANRQLLKHILGDTRERSIEGKKEKQRIVEGKKCLEREKAKQEATTKKQEKEKLQADWGVDTDDLQTIIPKEGAKGISLSEEELKQIEELLQGKIFMKESTPPKYAIESPMYKIEGGLYEIYLVSGQDGFYLSDEGATIVELDKIFELSEPDVIKNLVAILKQYDCKKVGKNITIKCNPKDVHIKMSYLIQAISFMLNMKIFYV